MNKMSGNIISLFITLVLLVMTQSCNTKTKENVQYYTLADFNKITKIDAHVHVFTDHGAFLEQAEEDDFVVLTINTEVPGYPAIEAQQSYSIDQMSRYPKKVYYLTTFETETRDEPDWQESAIVYLKNSFAQGAVGIKVWKNIGMVIKDQEGNFIKIDDPLFDPIFNFLEENDISVCGHIGEPKNCWLPVEEMTVNNDKLYFEEHPEYHMYLHPEYPSYDELIQSRDRLLEKHPDLKFVGAHLGSMEWSVDEIAKRLDRFPNMAVDLTERICHLQHQSINDWQKVYDFFIDYQDRILYGTDLAAVDSDDPDELKKHLHEIWTTDWKYFVTDETMNIAKVNGDFKGLKLPSDVVDKIYFGNARKWYPKMLP